MRVETVRRAAVFILKKGGGVGGAVDVAPGDGRGQDMSVE
jgi:hypothetical protein